VAPTDLLVDDGDINFDPYLDYSSDVSTAVRAGLDELTPERLGSSSNRLNLDSLGPAREFSFGPERRRWRRR